MMKKQLLLSLLVIVSTSSLFAQIEMTAKNKYDRNVRTENYTKQNNSKIGGGWFNYGREIETLGDISPSGAVLHTDSTMFDGYIDDGAGGTGDTVYYNVWHHSEGQMLDPTSLNFSNTGDCEFFLPGEGFILDTIEFLYGYSRPQTTNPDKLIVQIYTTDNGGIGANNPQSWGDLYPVSYNHVTSQGVGAAQTIEYELTDNDIVPDSVYGLQSFALDPPIEMPNGGLIAATYTFIPGNTFNSTDTLYSSQLPWIQNPRNSFSVRYFRDEAAVVDAGKQNYQLRVSSGVQYDVDTMGWNGSYLPGNIWSTDQGDVNYHQDMWFHLTPIAAAPSNTTNINSANINLYPNPANNKINIEFNNSNDVKSIRITDVTGRTVYTETTTNNTIAVNTSHFTPGIYFCEIKGTKTNETIKFTKIK